MVGGGTVKADPSIVFNRLFGLFLGVNFYLQSRSKEQLATHKADAISQRATIGKQISEVSASLEDIWMGMGCGDMWSPWRIWKISMDATSMESMDISIVPSQWGRH